ncbi:hypothetical protein [Streptomyces sp. TRM68367]|uniref:hypothetical protein n=1 Tax=Streptomyces sp. TRM68367 TaxID=2758415 RepID=UPI00165CC8CE|nr:hypothetical protein [Streptomyces sp. TRM68367]MBC9728371.1 hypothetical protein [Streptomyces sp. TRM68367]
MLFQECAETERERQVLTLQPARDQTCRPQGLVTYCAFPDFASRIGSWARVAEGELAQVPKAVADRPRAVRQRLSTELDGDGVSVAPPAAEWAADDKRAGTPDAIPVSPSGPRAGRGGSPRPKSSPSPPSSPTASWPDSPWARTDSLRRAVPGAR